MISAIRWFSSWWLTTAQETADSSATRLAGLFDRRLDREAELGGHLGRAERPVLAVAAGHHQARALRGERRGQGRRRRRLLGAVEEAGAGR